MDQAVLRNGAVSITVLAYGARVQVWQVARPGGPVPAVLGYADPDAYRRDPFFHGAIVGRVANRIGGAAYRHAGRLVSLQANDGRHQLHGGAGGLQAVDWHLETDGPHRLRLTHLSPDGAMGFPGTVRFEIDMMLDDHLLSWDMRALPDRETPISLAQHNYYRLGEAPVTAHIAAPERLERDGAGIMTGQRLPSGPLDCRKPCPLPAEADDFLLFDPDRDPEAPVAQFSCAGGLSLRMWSDQPGAQLYAGQWLQAPFTARQGFCLEPSGLPNAVNQPAFPSVMHSPERPYRQRLAVEITPT